MSFELVNEAALSPTFDPTPPPDSLAAAHVPFQLLTGSNLEADLTRRLKAYDRLALVGVAGAGKSSLARYVLRPNGQGLAPIWINVATEDHGRVATVRGFLEILVTQLLAKARRANSISDGQRRDLLRRVQSTEPLGSEEKRLRAELGGSYWLLKSSLAREVTRAIDHGSTYRAIDDIRAAVREALAAMVDDDLVPILVADDTDRLLRVGGDERTSQRLFTGFFGEVLREISENLECGLLLAAHDEYAARDDYGDLVAGRLSAVSVPKLERSGQIGQMITARVEILDQAASWRDLADASCLDRLIELHVGNHKGSIRKTLTDLRAGLGFAASDGAEHVTSLHIDAAAAG